MKKTLNALIATTLTCNMMETSQGQENFHPLINGSLPYYCTYPAKCLTYFNTTDGLQYVAPLNTTQNLMSPSSIASPMASPSANQEGWTIANYLSLRAIVTATIGIATFGFNIWTYRNNKAANIALRKEFEALKNSQKEIGSKRIGDNKIITLDQRLKTLEEHMPKGNKLVASTDSNSDSEATLKRSETSQKNQKFKHRQNRTNSQELDSVISFDKKAD